MTGDQIRAERMRSQRLDGRARDAAELVRHVVGVQAQEPRAGALSIRARTEGLTAADVSRALEEECSIVRTWAMRGTIHFVAAEDVRWLRDVFAPLSLPRQHRALDAAGVPADHRAQAVSVIRGALAEHGPLLRAELCERLERAGIATDGQKAAYLPRLAALEGHVSFGPMRGGKDTYALLEDDGQGARLDRDQAIAELARRYAAAYAPAEARDFAAWSGLPLQDVRAAWREAEPGLVQPPEPPVVRLLPTFDTYLLGYKGRELAVPVAHTRRVWPGGGIVRPTIVENGLVVGTWRRAGSKVTVEPFAHEPDVGDELADIERFLAA
jgi:hypothetical protein